MKQIVKITIDEKLKSENLTRYELSKRTKIKYQTIDNYYKNRVTRYDSDILLKICIALKCEIGDILKIVDV